MNTNTAKLFSTALLAHLMCLTVILSHVHAKDAVSLITQQNAVKQLASVDITAKALGDLHHHIDKTGLKSISVDNGSITAARTRQLQPLSEDEFDESLGARFHDFMLRLRVVTSLCTQAAVL